MNPADIAAAVSRIGSQAYLALVAAAPAEPPEWFHASMPAPCPMVPAIGNIRDRDLREAVLRYLEEDVDEGPLGNKARRWAEEQTRLRTEQEAWQAEFRRQVIYQWPHAWALGVLAAGNL